MKIGFFINPIAGMGGKVALKGTDGLEILTQAIKLGAKPIAPQRAGEFIDLLVTKSFISIMEKITLIVPPKPMGAQLFKSKSVPITLLEIELPEKTTAEDTKKVIKKLQEIPVNLVIFVGGDGTSVDILHSLSNNIPVIGIPSGVKTFGSIFTHSPKEVVNILTDFIQSRQTRVAEIIDLNEETYKKGKIEIQYLGDLLIPNSPQYFQSAKESVLNLESEIKILERIFEGLIELIMQEITENTMIILGPGSTFNLFAEKLNLNRSILGVDCLILNKQDNKIELILTDAREDQIFNLCRKYIRKLILITPIGGQGYIFGRGNHQLSPRIIKSVSKEGIWVVATPQKLQSIHEGYLRVDTSDPETDQYLAGYIRVHVDRNEIKMMKVVS